VGFFDVIVVDFPDPTNFAIGKLYTNSFYALLDKRLAASGYAVVQTTSPLVARQSFWTVVATIESVGLTATPYHAHVPSFGEWGFVLASRRPWRMPERCRGAALFELPQTLPLLFDFPLDMARVPAEVNRLSNQVLVTHLRARMGAFAGIDLERGHALRDLLAQGPLPAPTLVRRAQVIIAGGGVAGLAAARSAAPGRGARLCAAGAGRPPAATAGPGGEWRGLPAGRALPARAGRHAPEVQDLLEELGLRQRVAGRWQYDERHLCHSPQERLYFEGEWQEGLLPVQGVGEARWRNTAAFRRPWPLPRALPASPCRSLPHWMQKRPLAPAHQALDAMTFEAGCSSRAWTTRTCAGTWTTAAATTTAPAVAACRPGPGMHYFASRHGFHAPGEAVAEDREGVLTWPEGNGWLTQQLAAPLQGAAGQLHTGTSVLRIAETRRGVEVDAFNHHSGQCGALAGAERCVVALPVFVAARVVQNPPDFLRKPPSACNGRPGW
jgi:hypothetical protein